MAVHFKHAAIFTATRWELNAVRRALAMDREQWVGKTRCFIGHGEGVAIWLVQTGIGSQASSDAVRAVMAVQQFDLLVSSGFTTALIPAAVGDLMIGTEVVRYSADADSFPANEPCPCSHDVTTVAVHAAKSAGIPARVGRMATVSRILCRATEKQAVEARTGAIGSDMESSVICDAAQEHHVSTIIVRSVSDLHEENLPLDFNRFLGPAGWLRGGMHCLAHPSSVPGLYRMRGQVQFGAEQLTGFFKQFFQDLPRSWPPLLTMKKDDTL